MDSVAHNCGLCFISDSLFHIPFLLFLQSFLHLLSAFVNVSLHIPSLFVEFVRVKKLCLILERIHPSLVILFLSFGGTHAWNYYYRE